MFITIKMLLKMESQNNIFDQFKSAADQEEEVHMPFKEPLWERIEARLDEEPEQRRVFVPWIKYLAASVVLLLGIGVVWKVNQTDDKNPGINNNTIVAENKGKAPSKSDTVAQPVVEHIAIQKLGKNQNQAAKTGLALHQATRPDLHHTKPLLQQGDTVGEKQPVMVASNGQKMYQGILVDHEGNPLMGAAVYVKGNDSLVAYTQTDGKFRLSAPDTAQPFVAYSQINQAITKEQLLRQDTLMLNYTPNGRGNNTSYAAQVGKPKKSKSELSANASASEGYNTSTSYSLSSVNELSSVAVYGQRIDKRSYTGSINTIQANDIAKRPVTNIAQALSGAAPGVMVTTGSGQPGSTPDIMIRGQGSLSASTAPLILLDGVPFSGPLTSINPNDVDKIVVLKDATAKGIYGSRAANGIVAVTTKNGRSYAPVYKNDANSLFEAIFGNRKRDKAQKDFKAFANRSQKKEQKAAEEEEFNNESYSSFEENKFENPFNRPQSTFSIDVDKASYSNIRRFISTETRVPKDAVRIEEMVNYFSYQYPQPEPGNPFSINTEYSAAPWNPRHRLLKIGLQGKTIPQAELPASNLVFLIDVSGSMEAENKLPYVQQSMELLTRQLRKQDHVAIVVYAGAAGLVLPPTSGAEKEVILKAIKNLKAGGSTAGGAGIELAYKVAKEHFIPDGNNRIILATDGDFNVGASSDRSMQDLIEEKRKDNIFLTCLGFGMGNYKDSKMEVLADKGNGNYAYIDNFGEAKKVLEKEFGGTMYTIAKDLKIQIEFNPSQVQSYRLIGYENRKLNAEDFANDAVDAGELGSGHTVTALYEIIPKGVQSNYAVEGIDRRYVTVAGDTMLARSTELAQIKFRYKEPDGEKSKLITQNIHNMQVPLSQASKDFKLAASVAWFGLQLRDSKLVPDKSLYHIAQFAKEAIDQKNKEEAELLKLIESAQ